MGLVREPLGSVPATLSEVDGDGQSGGSRRNVHGSSSGKVETTHDEGPTVGIPGPVGNRVVDDGRPDEDEHHCGTEAAAFCDTADGDHGAVGKWT